MSEIFLFPVKIYRKYFSSLKQNPTCRFDPTCSEYALIAVREWGIIIGFVLAVIRIIRCNPFSRGGYDPVPTKKEFISKVKRLIRHPKDDTTHSEISNSNGENNV
ncbi:MAG: membrane protein insertion efficiency factor YidD [Ruminococcaceae bacterium]|nr:membrane protein insertion efficiency factor YidD [Oscillospiraceae bacterium]